LHGHEGGGWVVEVEVEVEVDEGDVVASIWGHVQMLDVWVLGLAVRSEEHTSELQSRV
jgi:hypothetical protein